MYDIQAWLRVEYCESPGNETVKLFPERSERRSALTTAMNVVKRRAQNFDDSETIATTEGAR